MLYLQEDIEEEFLKMLFGAMDELSLGDPWDLSTDVGPVINEAARADIAAHIVVAKSEGRLMKELPVPPSGSFISPTAIRVSGIADLKREVFGPVLHIATYRADELDAVVDDINATGFGLTFCMHSRIDDRIDQVTQRLRVGNMYINRNQIGAIVGSQPFGGEGLSGTGPKAGGPAYVRRFVDPGRVALDDVKAPLANVGLVQTEIDAVQRNHILLATTSLPGPTGESNRLSEFGRGIVLCLGPDAASAAKQMEIALKNGCVPIGVAPALVGTGCVGGRLNPQALAGLHDFDAVICEGDDSLLHDMRVALAGRAGKLIPLLSEADLAERCRIERHICIDTTAAGGNASLLAEVS